MIKKYFVNPLSARIFGHVLLENWLLHKEAWVTKLLGTHLSIQVHKKVKFLWRDNSPLALKGLTTLISLKFYVLMLISWSGDACIIESWWCWFESDWWKPFILVGSTLVKKNGFFMNDMKTWYIHSFKRWVERLKSLRVFYPNSWEAFFSLNCLQVCFFYGSLQIRQ